MLRSNGWTVLSFSYPKWFLIFSVNLVTVSDFRNSYDFEICNAMVFRARIDLLPPMLIHFSSSIMQSGVTNYCSHTFSSCFTFVRVFVVLFMRVSRFHVHLTYQWLFVRFVNVFLFTFFVFWAAAVAAAGSGSGGGWLLLLREREDIGGIVTWSRN